MASGATNNAGDRLKNSYRAGLSSLRSDCTDRTMATWALPYRGVQFGVASSAERSRSWSASAGEGQAT